MIIINRLVLGGIFSGIGGWFTGLFGDGDADPEKIAKIIQDYGQFIQYQNVFLMIWNEVIWACIRGLYFLNSKLEETIYQSFSLKDILKSAGMNELYEGLTTKVLAILCVLTLMFIGLRFAMSNEPPKPKNIFVNLAMSMIIIFGGNALIDEGVNITQSFYGDITNEEKAADRETPSFELIKSNVFDVSTVLGTDAKKLENIPTKKRNKLTAKNFKTANMNAVIEPDRIDDAISDLKDDDPAKERMEALKYRLDLDDEGKVAPIKIEDDNLAKYFYKSGYRRYTSFPGSILVGQLSLCIAYLFILFTIVTCIIELAFKKVYLGIAAATDFDHGQRRKTAVSDVINCLLLMAFTGLELTVYTRLLSGLATINSSGKINTFLYCLSLICLTMALFKGSQAVTKIFGVDTSLPNNGRSLLSMIGGAAIAKNAVKGAGSAVKKGASGLNSIRKNSSENKSNGLNNEEAGNTSGSQTNGKNNESLASNNAPSDEKSVAEAFAEKAGYVSKDVAEKAKDGMKGKATSLANKVTDPVKNAVDETKGSIDKTKGAFEEGQMKALDKNSPNNSDEAQEESNAFSGISNKQEDNILVPMNEETSGFTEENRDMPSVSDYEKKEATSSMQEGGSPVSDYDVKEANSIDQSHIPSASDHDKNEEVEGRQEGVQDKQVDMNSISDYEKKEATPGKQGDMPSVSNYDKKENKPGKQDDKSSISDYEKKETIPGKQGDMPSVSNYDKKEGVSGKQNDSELISDYDKKETIPGKQGDIPSVTSHNKKAEPKQNTQSVHKDSGVESNQHIQNDVPGISDYEKMSNDMPHSTQSKNTARASSHIQEKQLVDTSTSQTDGQLSIKESKTSVPTQRTENKTDVILSSSQSFGETSSRAFIPDNSSYKNQAKTGPRQSTNQTVEQEPSRIIKPSKTNKRPEITKEISQESKQTDKVSQSYTPNFEKKSNSRMNNQGGYKPEFKVDQTLMPSKKTRDKTEAMKQELMKNMKN